MYWNTIKERIATFCVSNIPISGIIGLGSGSTSEAFIIALGNYFRATPLDIACIASSKRSEKIAHENGLPIIDERDWNGTISVMFDGADALNKEGIAIKGAGGALVREKILAKAAERVILMIDERKWNIPLYTTLIPIAVIPFGSLTVLNQLARLGVVGTIRMKNNLPYITDDGLWIIDARIDFPPPSIQLFDSTLREMPAVVDTGIFTHITTDIVIGFENGQLEHRHIAI